MTASGNRTAHGQRVEIVTPEGIRFGLPLAGPVTRFLAWTVDALIIGAAAGAAARGLEVLKVLSADWYSAAATLAWFVISVGYGMLFEWWWAGQTPGKRMFALRVADAQGLKLTFHQIAIRNLIRFVDSLPLLYLIGGASLLLTRDVQRLGDIAAGTVVIRLSRLNAVDPAAFSAGKYNSLLAHPHFVAVLRQKATPELVEVTLQALARRDELAAGTQVEVFRAIREKYATIANFPEADTATMTDEQFVRNALQVVLSGPGRQAAAASVCYTPNTNAARYSKRDSPANS
jgi:uncharacterized RDD family membrane protein YckC